MAARTKSTHKRTTRRNDVTLEVAARLAQLAAEMRELVYGEDGIPEWGTRFTEIESARMGMGFEFARLFMEQAVDDQSRQVPEEAFDCQGETAQKTSEHKEVSLKIPAGEVQWEQPKTRLKQARRVFSLRRRRWALMAMTSCRRRCRRR